MEELHYIPIESISPNPYQPRLHFDEEKLQELADSIKIHGLIQPVIVRKSSVIGYELLAGERRLRASQLAGLQTIPVIVKSLSDEELLYQSIIENLQRDDLNPIEEAKSYQHLLQRGLTHEEIAQIMGKSRPYISNLIRLLQLSKPLIVAVEKGELSQGHARLLIPYPQATQESWMKKILETGMSVRMLENALSDKQKKEDVKKDVFLEEEEKSLRRLLGTDVRIQQQKNGKGSITIAFSNLEEFERIIQSLK